MLRLGERPDVILLAEHAIFVLEIKADKTAHTPEDRRQVEDYAIDLHDFHAGSRAHPVVPILIAERALAASSSMQLMLSPMVLQPLDATPETLPALLRDLSLQAARVAPPLDAKAWLHAEYCPVPTIVDAACMLYAKHNVADIRIARADAINLRATSDAILAEVERARTSGKRLVLFATGIPGAGKTLCGLNTVFGGEDAGRGTYLTGNPTLVHVLREALTRDAVDCGSKRSDAKSLSPHICWRQWLGMMDAVPSSAWWAAVRKFMLARAAWPNGATRYARQRQTASSGPCVWRPTWRRELTHDNNLAS